MKDRIEISFEQAYEQYSHLIYTMSLKMLKDEALAANVVQTVFTSFWENRNQIEVKMSIKAYLFASAKHAVLNIIRNRNVELKGNYCYAQMLEASDSDLDLKKETEEKLRRVSEAVSQLPEQQRMVLKMKMEGLKNPEIARKLGIALSTVKYHYNEGLKTVKQKLVYDKRRYN